MRSAFGLVTTVLLVCLLGRAALGQLTVYIAGDSTAANKTEDKRPETGWGEKLQQHFDPAKVKIVNEAQNGRSTKSFIDEGRWTSILDRLKKGDYVFIEFGHNDEKKDKPAIYAAPEDYKRYLTQFIKDVRAKGATPVLMTPVARRKFENGVLVKTHGEYPDAVKAVATAEKASVIDMEAKSSRLLGQLGDEQSRSLFLQLKPAENPNYPKGVEDNTHFNPNGASSMANLAVEGIRESKLLLAKLLLPANEFRSRLEPAPLDGGFRMDGYWVWCGSVIKGDDGKYHMFASRWPKPPGFGPYWLTNSEIVHAISDKPAGPYKFSEVALPPRGAEYWDGQMTHNPAIRKFGDTYLLYYTGTTYKAERPSAANRISETHPTKLEAHQNERIGLATSKSPYGPWKRLDKPILDVRPNSWEQYLVSNAAPVVMKDGRVMLYYKGVEKLATHAIGLAIADRFDGEYKRVSDQPLNMGIGAEDPFIWIENGKYKALMLDHERKYSPDKEIFYATSDNGIKWQVPADGIAVSRNILWADATRSRVAKTERPHVLIENGKPTQVFFAVSGTLNGAAATWNQSIPLKR